MLVPLELRDLHEHWPYVRAGLQRILDKLGDDWLPEDIYFELRSGSCKGFFIEHDGEVRGFVALQHYPGYYNGPRLFVRAIFGELAQFKHHIMQDLGDYGRENGLACSDGLVRIRCYSPRGWNGAGLGFEIKQHIFEAEV